MDKIDISNYLNNYQKDFRNHLINTHGDKVNNYELHSTEKRIFNNLNKNMINKSLIRIEEIKKRITNDINKNNFNKKYQIKSLIEYKIIKDYCKEIIPNYNLYYIHDDNIKMNILDKIIRGNYYCCRDCDTSMTFINKKTPVIYCYLYK